MISIEIIVQAELDKIKAQLPGRTARVSSALRNSVFNVMADGGVSAPGQPPGVRTGNYRNSFVSSTESNGMSFTAKVTSDCLYGPFWKTVQVRWQQDHTVTALQKTHCRKLLQYTVNHIKGERFMFEEILNNHLRKCSDITSYLTKYDDEPAILIRQPLTICLIYGTITYNMDELYFCKYAIRHRT